MNKALLIGNLTRDPECTTTQSGIPVCRFTIAINRRYADQNGQRQTDFLNIVTWRALAENCAQYLTKGRKVSVVGRIETRQYDDANGQRRYITEIVADEVEFLGTRGGTSADQDDMQR